MGAACRYCMGGEKGFTIGIEITIGFGKLQKFFGGVRYEQQFRRGNVIGRADWCFGCHGSQYVTRSQPDESGMFGSDIFQFRTTVATLQRALQIAGINKWTEVTNGTAVLPLILRGATSSRAPVGR